MNPKLIKSIIIVLLAILAGFFIIQRQPHQNFETRKKECLKNQEENFAYYQRKDEQEKNLKEGSEKDIFDSQREEYCDAECRVNESCAKLDN